MRFSLAAASPSCSSPAVAARGRPLAASARVSAALTPMSAVSSPSPSPTTLLPQRNRRALRSAARASASDDDARTSSGASTTTTGTVVVEERPKQQQEAEKATATTSQASSSSSSSSTKKKSNKGFFGLGDLLGPIGLTIGGSTKKDKQPRTGSGPIELGPIGMTVGASSDGPAQAKVEERTAGGAAAAAASTSGSGSGDGGGPSKKASSARLSALSTEEWRAKYEPDGCVDLWVEEEFNAGSRLVGGRAAHLLGPQAAGAGSGEGRVLERAAPVATHTVKIFNKATAQTVEVAVPEDRYVLWEAEDQGLLLPYACRMGCCTACAVRVKSGEMSQPEALGVAAELRQRGFALMCVGFAKSDLVLELAEEDEVYDLQFGDVFGERATDPSNGESIEKDPFALEVAFYDE